MLLIYVGSLSTAVGILNKLLAEKMRNGRAISEGEK
jgi:hypothetical protein